MCERFALDYPAEILKHWYTVDSFPDLLPCYNIAPMTDILVIRETETGREGSIMRWGLITGWVRDLKQAPVISNTRAETISNSPMTVSHKPMFRSAYRRRRCIIPASGFYEWQLSEDGRHKQPCYISTTDGCPISFAGIWETATLNEVTLESCAIITTESNGLIRPIRDRMPAILPSESIDTWLNPAELPDEILNFFLKPYDPELMQAWPVSTAVNKPSNQGKQLIEPIPSAES
ncbi:MAG: SOS response-associated peptidase [Proteobacteria bacterium]|nr:SOS response-associated peptidase [Pseudomonadota bacterium]